MSKTAEEILKEITGVESVKDDANILCEVSEIKQAMREFAAQEVDAYKRRLIAEVRADVKNSGPTMLIGDIALLIDAVK